MLNFEKGLKGRQEGMATLKERLEQRSESTFISFDPTDRNALRIEVPHFSRYSIGPEDDDDTNGDSRMDGSCVSAAAP